MERLDLSQHLVSNVHRRRKLEGLARVHRSRLHPSQNRIRPGQVVVPTHCSTKCQRERKYEVGGDEGGEEGGDEHAVHDAAVVEPADLAGQGVVRRPAPGSLQVGDPLLPVSLGFATPAPFASPNTTPPDLGPPPPMLLAPPGPNLPSLCLASSQHRDYSASIAVSSRVAAAGEALPGPALPLWPELLLLWSCPRVAAPEDRCRS